jgi:nitrite reductase/ring-hydroxylating ferredoxin subunit
MALQRVCSLDELPPGKLLKADLSGQALMLFNHGGELHAMSRVCLHRGGDLSSGELEGGIVTCPLHFWKFDLKDGVCVQVPSARLKTYPVSVQDNGVFVDA